MNAWGEIMEMSSDVFIIETDFEMVHVFWSR
jgi:hypothetical protein